MRKACLFIESKVPCGKWRLEPGAAAPKVLNHLPNALRLQSPEGKSHALS